MKLRKKLIKLNQKGVGIVTVIMAIAMVSILASVMLSTSYLNYRMKVTDTRTKDTFYSAESILDEINIGLQGVVSEALSKAYLEVFSEYSMYSIDEKNDLLENLYYNKLYDVLAADYRYTTYKMNELTRYVTASPWNSSTKTGYRITSTDYSMVTYSNLGIVLKNIEVYYRDANGRSSTITTDIRLCKPAIDFGAVTAIPDINKYVVVTDGELRIVADSRTTEITGNIYGDTINAISTSSGNINLSSDELIVAKNNINIEKATVTFPSRDAEIWANDLNIKAATVSVNGSLNLSDDISINGNGTSFSLDNRLNAYGTSTTDSNKSSAIVINGTNASLDFTGAEMVTIAGHAFVNTRKVNYGAVGGTEVNHGQNVYTGESISVKSNQLMYLIPGECIGVNKSEILDAEGNFVSYAYGTSKYNQNPITASQYASINNSGYEMVLTNRKVEALGHPLSDYIDYTSVGGISVPKYETVFVQTNGETMVYFYMSFASENKANNYFADYYGANADKLNSYLKYYVNNLVVPDPRNMVRLQVAGHFLTLDDATDTVDHRTNTVTNASTKLGSSEVIYSREKDALCTKLIKNYADLGTVYDTDLSHGIVFDNLINIDDWNDIFASQNTYEFYDSSYDFAAVLTNLAMYHYTGTDYSGKPVRLIVSAGDVYVDADFTGLILAKGNIYVANGVKLLAMPDDVSLTFWYQNLSEPDESKRFNIYNIFRDGSGIARDAAGVASTSQSLSLSNMVVFENWSKR